MLDLSGATKGSGVRVGNKFKMMLAAACLSCCVSAVPAPASAVSPTTSLRPENACDIIGTVASLKKVIRSPFRDGTPSTMVIIETHISVNVENREAHKKTAANSKVCDALPKHEMATYKLCSAEHPTAGDKILATEGGSTGSSDAARCLFDLQIMPKAQSAAAVSH